MLHGIQLTQCGCENTKYLSLVPSPIKDFTDSGNQEPVGYWSALETNDPAGSGRNIIGSKERQQNGERVAQETWTWETDVGLQAARAYPHTNVQERGKQRD